SPSQSVELDPEDGGCCPDWDGDNPRGRGRRVDAGGKFATHAGAGAAADYHHRTEVGRSLLSRASGDPERWQGDDAPRGWTVPRYPHRRGFLVGAPPVVREIG